MVQRKKSATVDVGLRVKEPMRAALDRSAKKRGISLNAEIVDRLERSLHEDQNLSGPKAARIAHMMSSMFGYTGSVEARARFGHAWNDDRWVDDPDCYTRAAAGVVSTLASMVPGDHRKELVRFLEAVVCQIDDLRLLAERGPVAAHEGVAHEG